MILEGIVTTLDQNKTVRISPMGPSIEPGWERFVLRPFAGSHTLANLVRTGQGVFHVTDDVELIAQAALDQWTHVPATRPASSIEGRVLTEACRWYEFQVKSVQKCEPRARLRCSVVERGFLREFFGLCRAKHAVVEAAILATRLHLLAPPQVLEDLLRLEPLVEKTGGQSEQRAFHMLKTYVSDHI